MPTENSNVCFPAQPIPGALSQREAVADLAAYLVGRRGDGARGHADCRTGQGGHTGGAYIHGFSQLIEAVRRARGEGTGERDDFAVISGAPTTPTSAALLGAEPLD